MRPCVRASVRRCVGADIMNGSVIVLEVYAKNVIPHLMAGKAITRALRTYFIVKSALVNLLGHVYAEAADKNDGAVRINHAVVALINNTVGIRIVNSPFILVNCLTKNCRR